MLYRIYTVNVNGFVKRAQQKKKLMNFKSQTKQFYLNKRKLKSNKITFLSSIYLKERFCFDQKYAVLILCSKLYSRDKA